jgi:hypothetical protein
MLRWLPAMRQVVQHAPAGGHAAGRQDDHGAMARRQGFGFVGAVDHGGAVGQRRGPRGRSAGAHPDGCSNRCVVCTAIGLSRKTGNAMGHLRPLALSWAMACSRACARPTANTGTTATPPRAATRCRAGPSSAKRLSAGVVGHRRWIRSAPCPLPVPGLGKHDGVVGRPRSPENRMRRPATSSSTLAAPKICPAAEK